MASPENSNWGFDYPLIDNIPVPDGDFGVPGNGFFWTAQGINCDPSVSVENSGNFLDAAAPDKSGPRKRIEMGANAKKALKKNLKKAVSRRMNEPIDFLPLEGGPGRKIREEVEIVQNTTTVLYIGHIPHGFYEEQMEGFFQQFGTVKRLRIARNRKTGKSKHYGFIEFENPEVAKVVADELNGYLLFEHNLQLQLIPPERVHPKLWIGVNRNFIPVNWTEIERKRHNKERTLAEHQKMVKGILKRDEKRRKRILAAGIDYECPELVGRIQLVSKKIKFTDDEED